MKPLHVIRNVAKVYLYLVGVFFILMAIDCFGDTGCPTCGSFWEHLLCFLISSVPGIVIILLNYFLRKQERILGSLLITLSVVAFFLFKFYREFIEKIPVFLIVVVLPLAIGIMFLIYPNDNNEKP